MEKARKSERALLVGLLFMAAVLGVGSANGDGIGGSGFVHGSVAQFRSIVVGGVHYQTENALVWLNGTPGDLSQIEVGHQVLALVNFATLEALEVHQYDAVTGKIEQIDVWDETLAQIHMRVLEQDVILDIETVFHVDPSKLKKDKHVTINGLRDASGVIRATSVEETQDKHELLIAGLVEDLDYDEFEIGDVKITSPYLAEYISEGWLYEGAAVSVRGVDYKSGVLEASSISAIPIEVVVLGYSRGYSEIRVDGEIDSYDPTTARMTVNGIALLISDRAVMHDLRDHVRWFGLHDLYPSDVVSLAATRDGGELKVSKLVRLKKAESLIRAPLDARDEHDATLRVLGKRIDGWEDADETEFAGEKVEDEELLDLLQTNDGIEFHWKKDGKLKRLAAVPDCGDFDPWQHYHTLMQLTKEELKALEKTRKALKKTDPRAYACFPAPTLLN